MDDSQKRKSRLEIGHVFLSTRFLVIMPETPQGKIAATSSRESSSVVIMRILVYKRTHNGDPDSNGCFGIDDCMGMVRYRPFDAVIGIGGIGSDAQANGIAGKVNWIGIGPRK